MSNFNIGQLVDRHFDALSSKYERAETSKPLPSEIEMIAGGNIKTLINCYGGIRYVQALLNDVGTIFNLKIFKMKNLFLLFIILSIVSCSNEESNVSSKRSITFQKVFNPNEQIGSNNELKQIEVEIVKKDGRSQMIANDIIEKSFIVNGEKVYMYSYKNMRYEGLNISSRGGGTGWNTGYIFDGGKCFVYCLYFENSDGSVVPWTCCGDTAGNCVGFDPVCAGPGEAWV